MDLDDAGQDLEEINRQVLDIVKGMEIVALQTARTAVSVTAAGVGEVAEAAGEGFARGMERARAETACPDCGAANPAEAAHCMDCGTMLEG